MRKNKQAQTHGLGLAVGELAVFLLAWMLSIFAALNDYRGQASTGKSVAASGSYSNMTDVLD